MKKLLLCLFVLAQGLGFELYINTGIENNKQIDILHIKNKEPFTCKKIITEQLVEYYHCKLLGKSKFISNQDLRYFKIDFKNTLNFLEIFIYPKTASRLINSNAKLFLDNNAYQFKGSKSTDFSIEFYPDLKEHHVANGLDFEVNFKDLLTPYIGPLDLDQNPVFIADNDDINIYLSIKRASDNKDYERLLELSNRAITEYPKSIFLNEFCLFRLRAYFGLLNTNSSLAGDLIDGAKSYVRTFPSSPNYAEVLRMLVHAYLKISQRADADYFIDILNNEQPDEYFTKLANLDYADFLLANHKKEAAQILYNNILFSSKDAELASKAAIALAKINISNDRLAEAKEFVLKVLNANKDFLLDQKTKTIALADDFYKHQMYEVAANIYELVLQNSKSTEPFYERLERNITKCLVDLKRFDEAKTWLDRYKKDFPVGEYASTMDEIADSLYFESSEKDSFKLHEYYRLLMAKYDNHIARRALIEETKLLYKEHNLEQIYALKERIEASENPELIQIYKTSLFELLIGSLHQDKCQLALNYLDQLEYSQLDELRPKLKLLSCLDRLKEYAKERELAEHFRQFDSIAYDLVIAKLDLLENKHAAIIKRINALLKTRRKKSRTELVDAYRLLALSYLKKEQYNDAIFALKNLEKYSDANMQMVELYSEFLGYFKLNHLDISAINYGTKAINIQNRLGINHYSPELEFITLEALQSRKQYKNMLSIITDLAKLNLSSDQRARMLYLKAFALNALGEQEAAKKALSECEGDGQWANLCKEAMNVQ